MKDLNDEVFIRLFRETCQKCFGRLPPAPLSEADSKLLVKEIYDQTGLVIGVKSIKNYSQYVFNSTEGKKENPSTATLDTLARYVLNAPETDETKRKKNEGHYPYWFRYRGQFAADPGPHKRRLRWNYLYILLPVSVFGVVFFAIKGLGFGKRSGQLLEEFHSVAADSLRANGWTLKNENSQFWERRGERPGHLSLFTLVGDNWPDPSQTKRTPVANLLYRANDLDCFSAEIHLSDFIPEQNWQQAGILLGEDSSFSGRALRLSISYNNFFGGYTRPPEIIIQAVGSTVDGNLSRPEEIAHVNLFSGQPRQDSLIMANLSKSALKIEKKGSQYRFLYAAGRMESFAFTEAAEGSFNIKPTYIGIFAMQGLADQEHPVPVCFDSFKLIGIDCTP